MSKEGSRGIKVKTPVFELEISENVLAGCAKPVQDAYGFVGDWIEDRRALARLERRERCKVRAAKVLIETQAQLKALNITDPQDLSDKVLELAGAAIMVEDNPSLQKMWATLLARAMNPGDPHEYSGLAQLLKDMPAEAALAFSNLANAEPDTGINLIVGSSYSKKRLLAELKGRHFDPEVGLEHLIRLRVFETVLVPVPQSVPLPVMRHNLANPDHVTQSLEYLERALKNISLPLPSQALSLTALGQELYLVATAPDSQSVS